MGQPVELLSYFRNRARSRDWSQQELAEFYRVESALVQHSLLISTDRGVSDEGDPWFVFCRAEDEEVIAHIARIGDQYLVVSSAFSGVAMGRDFKALVRALIKAHPMMLPARSSQAKKVFLHPTALLSAMVATAYLISSEKSAALEQISSEPTSKSAFLSSLSQQKVALLSAIAIAVTFVEKQIELAFDPAGVGLLQSKLEAQTSDQLQSVEHRPGPDQGFHLEGPAHKHTLEYAAGLEIAQEAHNTAHAAPTKAPPLVAPSEQLSDFKFSPSQGDAAVLKGAEGVISVANFSEPHFVVAIAEAEPTSVEHQSTAETGPATSTKPVSTFLNLALVIPQASAAQIIEADLANAFIHHNAPTFISLSAGNIAESLMQIGYSASDAHSMGALALGLDQTHANPVLPLATQDVAVVSLTPLALGSGDTYVGTGDTSVGSSAPLLSTTLLEPAVPAIPPVTVPHEVVPTPSLLPLFDVQANQILLSFLHDTHQLAIASGGGGGSMILMDINPADMQNPDFRVVEWQVDDGSTLTLIGIIPHAPIA